MADELTADLELDIKDALAAIDDLSDEIERAARDASDAFSEGFASAVSGVPDVDITTNVDDVAPAIEGAVADAEAIVPVEADIEAAEAAIESIGADAISSVFIEADTDPALADVADLAEQVESEPISLPIEADTTEAQDSVSGLGSVSEDATESIDGAAAATTALGSAGALSSGSIDALTGTVANLAGKAGPIGAIFAGSVVSLGAFTTSAINSLGATERFTTAFGNLAGTLDTIDVGNLSIDFKQLAIDTGSSGSAMRNAATDSFQFMTSMGSSREEAAKYSEQILALAGRAVALNPSLGETGEVAKRLESALRSGRDKGLIPYQLGITGVEINQRAATIALEDGRVAVTQADKAAAGAALAVENLGSRLRQDIAEGSKNPILAMRAIGKEFGIVTSEIGKPLVAPIFDVLRTAMPSVKAIGESLGLLAQSALPILQAGLAAIAPVLEAFADGLAALGPAGIQTVAGILAIGYAFNAITDSIAVFQTALTVATTIMEANPFILLATGIAVAITALGLFSGGQEEASASTKQLTDDIVAQNGALGENALEIVNDQLGTHITNLNKADVTLGEYTDGLNDFTKATKAQGKALELVNPDRLGIVPSNKEWIASLREASPALADVAEKLDKTGQLTGNMKQLIYDQAQAIYDGATANREFTKAEEEKQKALDFTKEKTDQVTAAEKDHKAALYEAKVATQERTLASQQQAAEDAVHIGVSQQIALANRSQADSMRAISTENTATMSSFDNALSAMIRYRDGTGTAKEATDALAQAESALGAQLDLLLGRFLSADQALNAFKLAQMGLGPALLANGFAFDQATEAGIRNRDAVSQLGQTAITAGQNILSSTGNITAARAPLEEYRATVQKLRDDMARAGQDTTFLDSILLNVDNALAGITAKAPEAYTAGQTVAQGAADGISGNADAALNAGIGIMDVTVGGILGTEGAFAGAGTTVGGANVAGLGGGLAPGPGLAKGVSNEILGAMSGNESLARAAGYTIGWSFVGGINTGLGSIDVSSTVVNLVNNAFRAGQNALDAKSPSRKAAKLIGLPLAQGVTLGIDKGAADVMTASENLVRQSLDTMRATNGAPGGNGGGTPITFNISVNGVTDASVARKIGQQVGRGAVDAMTRRNVVTQARLG